MTHACRRGTCCPSVRKSLKPQPFLGADPAVEVTSHKVVVHRIPFPLPSRVISDGSSPNTGIEPESTFFIPRDRQLLVPSCSLNFLLFAFLNDMPTPAAAWSVLELSCGRGLDSCSGRIPVYRGSLMLHLHWHVCFSCFVLRQQAAKGGQQNEFNIQHKPSVTLLHF